MSDVAKERYYFHLENGFGIARDEEGQEMADLAAAKAFAIDSIRSILKGDLVAGVIDLRGKIEIADGQGAVLAVVRFPEAVEVRESGGRE